MKRSSPLWGSVSVLIGVVIAILALVRGAWLVPLLLLTFTAWGLWVVIFQLQPAWDSIRGYRRYANALQTSLLRTLYRYSDWGSRARAYRHKQPRSLECTAYQGVCLQNRLLMEPPRQT